MKKSISTLLLTVTLIFTFSFISILGSAGVKADIIFDKGKYDSVIQGGVIRGDRDRYFFRARKGQSVIIKIMSLEDNAVFDIQNSQGQAYSNAREKTSIQFLVPKNGKYTIEVGGTRGNSTYVLWVTIL